MRQTPSFFWGYIREAIGLTRMFKLDLLPASCPKASDELGGAGRQWRTINGPKC